MRLIPRKGSTFDPVRIYDQRGSIIGKRLAAVLRNRYETRVRAGHLRPVASEATVDLDLLYFSCERDLPEQVLSIRSFLANVGRPRSLTIISDGSITTPTEELLRHQSPVIRVRSVDDFLEGMLIPVPVQRFASEKAYGRKLAVLLAMHPRGAPVAYSDSDVLFYPGASGLSNLIDSIGERAYFLQDCQPALDERLVRPPERIPPLNSGFLLTNRSISWDDAVARLDEIGEADAPGFGWTEQSVAHIAYRDSAAEPLPPEYCLVALHDQYRWADPYYSDGIWLRHYVTGTRFKMWLSLVRRSSPLLPDHWIQR